MKGLKGFTLIEVLIVVAIIGILSSIAMPMYRDYIAQTSRTDAYTALYRMADQQEQFVLRTNAGAYTTVVGSVGGSATERDYYEISIVSADANGYVLQATARAGGPQENDREGATDCSTLTLSSTGLKTPAECWVQ